MFSARRRCLCRTARRRCACPSARRVPSKEAGGRAAADTSPVSGPSRRLSPTIYDVARAAGVAPSTVSRALSRPGRVNPETAEHVQAVAAAIGYQGHARARTHSPQNLPMIGVLVSDVTDPAVAEFICGAESAAAEANYTILLSRCQMLEQGETEALSHILGNVEGVVLASARIAEPVLSAIGERWPLVVLDQPSAGVPSVVTNQSQGAHLAAEHLSGLGHQSLSYVAGPEKSWSDWSRWHALQNAASVFNLDVRRLGPFTPTLSGGCQAAAELVRSRTSAVITYNDHLALGIIRRLTQAGVRVPEDVSIVGYDDIPAARLVTPSLTTIAAPTRAQGIVAVHRLLSIIKGARSRLDVPMVLPVQLVIRESSGRIVGHRPSADWRSESDDGAGDRRVRLVSG